MMGAMLTSYNVVNNSYSQVTDKAKISNQAKVVLGMIMADIRNAGFIMLINRVFMVLC